MRQIIRHTAPPRPSARNNHTHAPYRSSPATRPAPTDVRRWERGPSVPCVRSKRAHPRSRSVGTRRGWWEGGERVVHGIRGRCALKAATACGEGGGVGDVAGNAGVDEDDSEGGRERSEDGRLGDGRMGDGRMTEIELEVARGRGEEGGKGTGCGKPEGPGSEDASRASWCAREQSPRLCSLNFRVCSLACGTTVHR